jgi:hypothetical protein
MPGKAVVPGHPGNERVFNNDGPPLWCQHGAELVDGVFALVGDPARSLTQGGSGSSPPTRRWAPLLGGRVVRADPAGHRAPVPPDRRQRTVQVPRVGDLLPAREDGKGSDPEVDTHHRVSRCRGQCWSLGSDGERHQPAAPLKPDRGRHHPRSASIDLADQPARVLVALILPSRGRTACLVSQPVAPVVNRTEPPLRCLDLNRANPTGAPLRLPVRESPQFFWRPQRSATCHEGGPGTPTRLSSPTQTALGMRTPLSGSGLELPIWLLVEV